MTSTGELHVRARRMRRELTPAEKVLWASLRDRQILNVKFRRQHPVGQFILDFYAAEVKLAFEVDGQFHALDDVRARDRWRTSEVEKMGIRIIRFSNAEVLSQMDWVIAQIKTAIEVQRAAMADTTSPPSPLSIP